MIINLTNTAKKGLKYSIQQRFNSLTTFCNKNNFSLQVLSRQLKTGNIDYEILIKYLIALNILPKGYSIKIRTDENFFLYLMPEKYKKEINELF